jgi:hypothetical protein
MLDIIKYLFLLCLYFTSLGEYMKKLLGVVVAGVLLQG